MLTADAALMGMEFVFLFSFCGGLWPLQAAIAPLKRENKKKKQTQCLFINHTTPFNEKKSKLLFSIELRVVGCLRLALFSWPVSCLWVGFALGLSPRQLAQREDERPRKQRKEQEEINGNGINEREGPPPKEKRSK